MGATHASHGLTREGARHASHGEGREAEAWTDGERALRAQPDEPRVVSGRLPAHRPDPAFHTSFPSRSARPRAMKRRVRILPGTGTCPAAAGGGPPVQKPLVFARGTLGGAWVRHIVSHGLAREGQPRNMSGRLHAQCPDPAFHTSLVHAARAALGFATAETFTIRYGYDIGGWPGDKTVQERGSQCSRVPHDATSSPLPSLSFSLRRIRSPDSGPCRTSCAR